MSKWNRRTGEKKSGEVGIADGLLTCGELWFDLFYVLTCSPVLQTGGLSVAFMFENLEVYQKALDFTDEITTLTATFPRGYYFLADQLNRAALSIATNLAEGNGRFTKADRKNFFVIARGSLQECVPLLELACRKGLVDESCEKTFRSRIEIIAKMISGLINGLVNRQS